MTTLAPIPHPLARSHERPEPRSRPRVARAVGLLTFNIGAAGEIRAAAILTWLRSRGDDVIVLTETTEGPGTALLAHGLRSRGYDVRHVPIARERGVLVASRLAIARDLSDDLAVTLPCRASALLLGSGPTSLALVGIYVPSRDRSDAKVARKQAFIASLLRGLRALPAPHRRRLVLAGDYNTVARRHEPRLPGFFAWEYGLHDELERIGLRPAHELRGRGQHPHSWIGRTGLGYLYDYVHIGTGLHRGVERCDYLHGPRQQRLSDHAAVAVRVTLD
jgi:exodeoxyribonuclease-3